MDSFVRSQQHFREKGFSVEDFYDMVHFCLRTGFVYKDEECFLCARPVFSKEVKALDEEGYVSNERKANLELDKCDTWFVYMATGNMSKAFDVIPPLEFVAFERFDCKYRLYNFKRMRRLCDG